jgi:hypothetical protein
MFQGKSLGKWLIGCVNEVVSSWPELKRMMLITSGEVSLYRKELGMAPFGEERAIEEKVDEGKGKKIEVDGEKKDGHFDDLRVWNRKGRGCVVHV